MSKINEESVIVVTDEQGEPGALIRKSTNNGGKVQMFLLKQMTFTDVEFFLKKLAGEDNKKTDGTGK